MKYGTSSNTILGVDLKEVQQMELDILLVFDRICKKHNIHYQLYAGTLLGAIRHRGFIPWDDDIDVCMLRSDFDQFSSLAAEELSPEYFFQTNETDPLYMNRFAKIRRNGTVFKEKLVEELDMHHGLFIDIFPYDNILINSFQGKFQLWLLRTLNSFFKHRLRIRYEALSPSFEKTKAKFQHNLIKILPISKLRIDRAVLKLMKRFNHIRTEYIADLTNPSVGVLEKFIMKRETIEDYINGDFEGYCFPVPRNYHEVLTRAYGDYMQQPDEYHRGFHHDIVEIDLGEH